jgi:diacylglycerol kinase (ATP)
MARWFFIVNPAAGHGRAKRLWRRFESTCRPAETESGGAPNGWRVEQTSGRGHAERLVQQALADGYDRIVAVGGDGTLSEVAGGLLAALLDDAGAPRAASHAPSADLAIGHFPVGSGCDMARHFQLPRHPADWQTLIHAPDACHPIDAARVTWTDANGQPCRRYFVNIAMAGIAGDIAHTMDRCGKPLGGVLSYLVVTLLHALRARPKPMRLVADGRELPLDRYHLVALANTSTTGGGMRVAPGADAADGMLDLVLLPGLPRRKLLWNFPRIYKGTHLKIAGVRHLRLQRLKAECDEEVLLNIDGEPCGRLPAEFEVLPKVLRFLLPSYAAVPMRPAAKTVVKPSFLPG